VTNLTSPSQDWIIDTDFPVSFIVGTGSGVAVGSANGTVLLWNREKAKAIKLQ
jgi:hypothetical protein